MMTGADFNPHDTSRAENHKYRRGFSLGSMVHSNSIGSKRHGIRNLPGGIDEIHKS